MKHYLQGHFLLLYILLLPFQSFCTESKGFCIIGDLPADCSLLKKVQMISIEEKKIFSPDFYNILIQLKDRIEALKNGEVLDDTLLHEELTSEEALDLFGPCLEINNYLENPFVTKTFSKSFSPKFCFARFNHKTKIEPENYFNTEELEEIYQTANEILKMTSYGDHLISLGQSPAYVVEALEELTSKDVSDKNFRYIYKVPCSGAPDYSCLNTHYKRLQLANVITPKSLEYYKQVLSGKGVCPLKLKSCESLYVIDLMGTGGSMAAFLKVLINWYDSLGVSLPEFRLLDISVENRNFKNENRVILPLADNCQIHIDRYFIHTSAHLSDKLDYTEGEDRIIPPFSPLQWKMEYEHVFNQYPNEYAKKVIECVRNYARNKYVTQY